MLALGLYVAIVVLAYTLASRELFESIGPTATRLAAPAVIVWLVRRRRS